MLADFVKNIMKNVNGLQHFASVYPQWREVIEHIYEVGDYVCLGIPTSGAHTVDRWIVEHRFTPIMEVLWLEVFDGDRRIWSGFWDMKEGRWVRPGEISSRNG
jgi:hypothetical protein